MKASLVSRSSVMVFLKYVFCNVVALKARSAVHVLFIDNVENVCSAAMYEHFPTALAQHADHGVATGLFSPQTFEGSCVSIVLFIHLAHQVQLQ